MLPYHSLLVVEHHSAIPVYRQIANQLIALIQQGKVNAGVFLPGTRELATTLGVHRNTVINAYDDLLAQGWVQSLPRRGFQVIPELPVLKPRSFQPKDNYASDPVFPGADENRAQAFNFPKPESAAERMYVVNDGFPDVRLAPFDQFMKEYRALLNDGSVNKLFYQPDYGGTAVLKDSVSEFLNQTRGLNISADHLVITRGAQMAIYIAAAMLIRPGDRVIVTEPSYFMADEIFRKRGAVIHRIPVDQDGMEVDQLEALLPTADFRLLYVIPHHHHPTTVTMSASRRIKLLNLIKQYRIWVIEDDYDYDFHYQNSPILPLASSEHGGQIVYIGSFTKLLAPSIRIGYLVAGKAFVDQAIAYKKLIDMRGDVLMEGALSAMIISGDLNRHIKRSRKIYAGRLHAAAQLMESELGEAVSFTKPQGGMALWLKFHERFPLARIARELGQKGIHLAGSAYYQGANASYNSFRFGFASLNDEELATVVGALRAAVQGE